MQRDPSQSRMVDAWLDQRSEPAPPTLRACIAAAIGAVRPGVSTTIQDLSSHAGEMLLTRLLAEGCAARAAAADLLASDALVTYSFEAAAEDPRATARAIGERAARTMLDIALLGADA